MYIAACSLEAGSLFPLNTVRKTFLYWTITVLLYADNSFKVLCEKNSAFVAAQVARPVKSVYESI